MGQGEHIRAPRRQANERFYADLRAAALVLLASARSVALLRRGRYWQVPVYVIGTMASYWTIERIAGF